MSGEGATSLKRGHGATSLRYEKIPMNYQASIKVDKSRNQPYLLPFSLVRKNIICHTNRCYRLKVIEITPIGFWRNDIFIIVVI